MRRALTMLVFVGALAGLFVSASRAPRTTQRIVATRTAFVVIADSCSASPLDDLVCGSHAEAEKVLGRLRKYQVGAAVRGRRSSSPA